MNRNVIRIPGAVAAIALWCYAGPAMTYSAYTDSQCSSCHSGFVDKGPLHDTHTSFISSSCNMCHPSGPGSKPVSTSSAGMAGTYSCLGCHGNDYGGSTGMQAAGLRAHHAAHSVSCSGCHSGDPAPIAENVAPPHYALSAVNLDTCSDNLDNDGDDDYDMIDINCAVPVEETTWGRIKSLYK